MRSFLQRLIPRIEIEEDPPPSSSSSSSPNPLSTQDENTFPLLQLGDPLLHVIQSLTRDEPEKDPAAGLDAWAALSAVSPSLLMECIRRTNILAGGPIVVGRTLWILEREDLIKARAQARAATWGLGGVWRRAAPPPSQPPEEASSSVLLPRFTLQLDIRAFIDAPGGLAKVRQLSARRIGPDGGRAIEESLKSFGRNPVGIGLTRCRTAEDLSAALEPLSDDARHVRIMCAAGGHPSSDTYQYLVAAVNFSKVVQLPAGGSSGAAAGANPQPRRGDFTPDAAPGGDGTMGGGATRAPAPAASASAPGPRYTLRPASHHIPTVTVSVSVGLSQTGLVEGLAPLACLTNVRSLTVAPGDLEFMTSALRLFPHITSLEVFGSKPSSSLLGLNPMGLLGPGAGANGGVGPGDGGNWPAPVLPPMVTGGVIGGGSADTGLLTIGSLALCVPPTLQSLKFQARRMRQLAGLETLALLPSLSSLTLSLGPGRGLTADLSAANQVLAGLSSLTALTKLTLDNGNSLLISLLAPEKATLATLAVPFLARGDVGASLKDLTLCGAARDGGQLAAFLGTCTQLRRLVLEQTGTPPEERCSAADLTMLRPLSGTLRHLRLVGLAEDVETPASLPALVALTRLTYLDFDSAIDPHDRTRAVYRAHAAARRRSRAFWSRYGLAWLLAAPAPLTLPPPIGPPPLGPPPPADAAGPGLGWPFFNGAASHPYIRLCAALSDGLPRLRGGLRALKRDAFGGWAARRDARAQGTAGAALAHRDFIHTCRVHLLFFFCLGGVAEGLEVCRPVLRAAEVGAPEYDHLRVPALIRLVAPVAGMMGAEGFKWVLRRWAMSLTARVHESIAAAIAANIPAE